MLFRSLHARSAVFAVQRQLHAERDEPLTAVLPGVTLDELWQVLALGEAALQITGALVALASLAGLVSVMLAGLDGRRRELAILRSVGASPRALMLLLMVEGSLASLAGIVLGLATGALLMVITAPLLQAHFGILLGFDLPRPGEWILLAAILGTGILASLLPAGRAWAMSLADGLSPSS